MGIIRAGMRNEFIKLLSLKKYRVLLLFACLFSILTGVLGGAAKGIIGLLSTNTPITVLAIAAEFVLPLMIAVAAADLFTAEQENGSIKASLTRPVSRISIFTSKVLVIILYIAMSLAVCLITTLVWSTVFNGMGLYKFTETFLAYTVSIVPMLPIILFAVLVSQFCKSSSSTVMLSVFGYLIIIAISLIFPNINPMLFTSYTGWYKLFIGAGMPVSNILNVLALLAAYSLIFFAAGSWAFEKKEY
jgi:ABC-2 type transport system permease protein